MPTALVVVFMPHRIPKPISRMSRSRTISLTAVEVDSSPVVERLSLLPQAARQHREPMPVSFPRYKTTMQPIPTMVMAVVSMYQDPRLL